MKHALTIAICLLMLAGVACKKRRSEPAPPPANELHYKETHCANPWTSIGNHLVPRSDTQAIKTWLLEKDITTLKVTITPYTGGVTCEACHCLSTRIVKVLFNPADIEKAKALGFYKP
ncbi:hypothetical protein AAHN97_01015 [Chitinophaga niabensis]|uniref:hypothetical protein n=1 Tax=Chitinophaga niabensis TaxID=536979 RepID=UPI0031BA567C